MTTTNQTSSSSIIPNRQLVFNKICTSVDIHQDDDCKMEVDDNFPMGCSISPDGTCVLTATAGDGQFRLYDIPRHSIRSMNECNNDEQDNDDDDSQGEVDNFPVVDDDDDNNTPSICRRNHQNNEDNKNNVSDLNEGGGGCSHNQNHHVPQQPERQQQQRQRRNNHDIFPWKASLTSHQGGPAPPSSSASYAWYPQMSSSNPTTSIYLTCRGPSTPIHLIDAYTSQLRASYRTYNSVDCMEGPSIVSFNACGSRVYGTGFKTDRTIAIFDTSIPGRDGMIARMGKTRRSSDGQKGIPSAIAFPKQPNDVDSSCSIAIGPSNVFAVGTYSPASIYIYDDRMSNVAFNPAGTIILSSGVAVVGHGRAFSRKRRRFVDNSTTAAAAVITGGTEEEEEEKEDMFASARVNWFQSRAHGGVTQLSWAPGSSSNPHVLFSASRRSDVVLSWDVRALSGCDDENGRRQRRRPVCGLRSYSRGDGVCDTNQRLEFELDECGQRLFVGSSDEGLVRIYDVTSGKLESTLNILDDNGVRTRDAVNGLSYFPNNNEAGGNYDGLLVVAVGSRCFEEVHSDTDDDKDDNYSSVSVGANSRNVATYPPAGCLQLHGMTASN